MEKKYEVIDKIIEIEIYLYIIFMFLTKGEGIRNILIFSGFFLWLTTLKYRKNKSILKGPVPLLLWGFIATILTSVVSSIDPIYSFLSLREAPLKSIILLCLISTTLSDEKRLKRFVYLSFFILLFTISVGYYSYWVYDLPLMKPVTFIRHAWHTRFARDINTLLPFSFIVFLIVKDIRIRALVTAAFIFSISAIVLSTSRGGMMAFISLIVIWLIYIVKKFRLNLKLIMTGLIIIVIIFGTILYYSPHVKQRFITSNSDITTFNERTYIWQPLISAAMERPILGWGYGSKIFMMDKPFENTPFIKAPVHVRDSFRNPHNSFLKIFFHQGIIGVIAYIMLLIIATVIFWRNAYSTHDLKSYIFIACASVLISTYFVNSLLQNPRLTDLTLILGIGLAAKNSRNENG